MRARMKGLVFFLTLLILTVFSLQLVNEVGAQRPGFRNRPLPTYSTNDYDGSIPDAFKIISPQEITINQTTVFLNFTLQWYGNIGAVGYSLDDAAVLKVRNLVKISEELDPNRSVPPYVKGTYLGNLTLASLHNGNHTITVYHEYQYQSLSQSYIAKASAKVKFTINSPEINILQNKGNYTSGEVRLRFVTSESTTWIGYSLDNQANATINGNTTITGIANGYHNVTIYAKDRSGNIGVADTMNFNVETPPDPSTKPVNLIPVGAILTVLFVLSIASVVLKVQTRARKQTEGTEKQFRSNLLFFRLC
jgi:hypothetical protein